MRSVLSKWNARAGASLLVLAATPAWAGQAPQPGADPALAGEIIVTAQQRKEPLRKVPLSITAIGSDTIQQEHITAFSDLAKLTPGYVAGSNYSFNRFSSLRGISNNQFGFADDPSIAMFVDGVYQGRGATGMQASAFYDVDRVEVIKGPQATLFGRSSIGGAISVMTNQPSTAAFSADAMLGVGAYGRIVTQDVVNIPITPDLAIRIAGDFEHHDPYFTNLNGGKLGKEDVKSGRFSLLYTGIRNLTVTFKATIEQRDENGALVQAAGLPAFTVDENLNETTDKANNSPTDAMLKLNYRFSNDLQVTSTTAYRDVRNQYATDYDGTNDVAGGPWTQHTSDKQFSQDLIFNLTHGKLTGIFGGSFFTEAQTGFVGNWVDANEAFTGYPAATIQPNSYADAFYEAGNTLGRFHGYSVFGDFTYEVLRGLRLTGGVRYNSDTKTYTQDIADPADLPQNAGKAFAGAYYNWGYWTSTPITSHRTWTNTAFRATVSYDVAPAITTYASFNQGWKAGGIDSFKATADAGFPFYFGEDISPANGHPATYNPEKSNSYEVGVKGHALANAVAFNLALYDFTYRDLQIAVQSGATVLVQNVGHAYGRGFEGDATLQPWSFLRLNGGLAYNFTKITDFAQDPAQIGQPLNMAPMWSGSAAATLIGRHIVPGELSYTVDTNFRSGYRVAQYTQETVPPMALLNMRVQYRTPDQRYSVSVFADNVLNKYTWAVAYAAIPFIAQVPTRTLPGDPRVIGVDFRAHF
jgi:iron complex outermembrane recepter protein